MCRLRCRSRFCTCVCMACKYVKFLFRPTLFNIQRATAVHGGCSSLDRVDAWNLQCICKHQISWWDGFSTSSRQKMFCWGACNGSESSQTTPYNTFSHFFMCYVSLFYSSCFSPVVFVFSLLSFLSNLSIFILPYSSFGHVAGSFIPAHHSLFLTHDVG